MNKWKKGKVLENNEDLQVSLSNFSLKTLKSVYNKLFSVIKLIKEYL